MGFQIQPRELEIPDIEPFANDKLGRKEPAEILTRLVRSFDGPCVIAIDAAWGKGKTTFLKMWARHLRNEGCPVVEFNAWETDFAVDPFVALTNELIQEIRSCNGFSGKMLNDFKSAAGKILSQVGLESIKSAATLLGGPIAETAVGGLLDSLVEGRMSEYAKSKQAMSDFRTSLRKLASDLGEEDRTQRPLVVVIDELDRCRPTYAIELLETAKHFFSVDGVIFALGVHRAELEHSVSAVYGVNFDGAGYLRRFFDIDFHLPEADQRAFIDAWLSELHIEKHFQTTLDNPVFKDTKIVSQLLVDFLGSTDLNLRTVEQSLHRLALVMATLPNNSATWVLTATIALILRTLEPDLYHRLAQGQATDEEVAVSMFGRMVDSYRYTHAGHILEFEILRASAEEKLMQGLRWQEVQSPLLAKYRALISEYEKGSVSESKETKRAFNIIDWTKHDQNRWLRTRRAPMFRKSYERLELLSTDLLVGDQLSAQ